MTVRAILAVLALLIPAGVCAAPAHSGDLVTERAVLVMRHGIRAPLDGEVPDGTRTDRPWPVWSVAQSVVTPHGERALEIVAETDRRLLASRGLLDAAGCPKAGAVSIVANTSPRAIASAVAYVRGFAPKCDLKVSHLEEPQADPIFEPLRAKATAFDADAAVADINRSTGGMARLAERDRKELALLNHVLGCGEDDCLPPAAPAVTGQGHDIVLSGPIRSASGIAQVLLLQYLEGMPVEQVGWGRIDAAGLQRLGRLHADLFTVYTRPPYMAAHQASALGRRILDTLDHGAAFELLMGHDTNVTALAAALGVNLPAEGYATNDVPPGGAILIERLRDVRSNVRYVRAFYRTQPPEALRGLSPQVSLTPLRIPECAKGPCRYDAFAATFGQRLAK
ncbi:MAG: histidine-type phosphatase [Novosphingobium sp.]